MKIFKILSLSLLIVAFAAGCKKGPDPKKMAAKMCECSKDMMALIQKMMTNPDAMADMTAEAEKVQKDFMDCMGGEEELKKMDEGMNEEEKKKFEEDMKAELKKKCPDVANMMGLAQ